MSERKPHKHAEVIKAWADGATIQYFTAGDGWVDLTAPIPGWLDHVGYRIKPEPKEDVHIGAHVFNDGYRIGLQRHFDSNVVFIFCGETGKIKGAQVIA